LPGKPLEVEAAALNEISEILKRWPKDCPQRPRFETVAIRGIQGIQPLQFDGIVTLTSSLGTVDLYHVERPRELMATKMEESEIPGQHKDTKHYRGDKSDRLELTGFIDSLTEYNIKSTLKTMRQGQDANPISVTVRFGATPIINSVQYWLEDFDFDPEPGYGVYVANYTIKLTKRD